ncbi:MULTISPECIES: hypothetical protein [unclassified Shewanella]|uniref:hypothetical protein n=1 Tax=unclassified Shewanella TaxID=196818 RepID=UPI0020056234|nr:MULTISPECIES: hypothetical protein [unclassified Shewanella]MCK7633195.1 hypothetical protein [Shewanella sp. JNE17]MCK7648205.1 hypothetical protein [Shewanella sp. JNE8]MCK7656299.1 hypothetical protein [Shewanella sp. JNE4-2]UPO32796.1 hypothetical protein MZ182_08240 [Shewanella sp. JNE2]
MAPEGRVSTRFILRLRLLTEHHYAFKPSPCLKRVELPLNEQIFNTIGINTLYLIQIKRLMPKRVSLFKIYFISKM